MVADSKKRAYQKVNSEMIMMYYQIGQILSEKPEDFVAGLSKFFETNYQETKSFDETNLNNMKIFYELYKSSEIVERALINLSWEINLVLMSECKTMDERIFYIDMCLEEQLSVEELKERIKDDYYKKYMESKKKDDTSFDEIRKIVDKVLSDDALIEYMNKQEQQIEEDMKETILDNLKEYVLKNNKNTSLFGEKYETDFDNLVDVLFINKELSSLIALDLKLGKFKQEYLNKMKDNLEYLDNYFKIVGGNSRLLVSEMKSCFSSIFRYYMYLV